MKSLITRTVLWTGLALLAAALQAQGAAAHAPVAHAVGEMRYMSGGVGIDERDAMREQMGDYNLHLKFAAVGGAYLAKVMVRIEDPSGRRLLDAQSDGPWFFVKMPKGKYKLIVENGGISQAREVDLSKKAAADVVFRWKVAQTD